MTLSSHEIAQLLELDRRPDKVLEVEWVNPSSGEITTTQTNSAATLVKALRLVFDVDYIAVLNTQEGR